MNVEEHYVKLNVEKYGGMLCAPWFDRPLSVAGRLIVKENNRLVTKLINVDRDLVMIPNLAIHMNREANKGYDYNIQKDMLPLYGCGEAKGKFMKQNCRGGKCKRGRQSLQVTCSFTIAMKGSIWELAKNSFPVRSWMIFSAHFLHWKLSCSLKNLCHRKMYRQMNKAKLMEKM